MPLSLFYQLSRPANVYFLILSILQTVPSITVTEGAPTILTGLIPMIIISMFKDLLEDLKRRADDEVENT